MTREARIGIVQAVAATGCFSTGAVLVRWAQDLSPVEVTSLRLLLGGLLVAAAAWGSGERVGLAGGELRRLIPIALIAAQEVTGSILLAWLLLHEAPPWNAVAGAGMTLVGVAHVLL